jgi:hypothetical protein
MSDDREKAKRRMRDLVDRISYHDVKYCGGQSRDLRLRV